jgi:hypothetical protein
MPRPDDLAVKDRVAKAASKPPSFAASEHVLDLTHLRPKRESALTGKPPSAWFRLRAAMLPHRDTHTTLAPRPSGHPSQKHAQMATPPTKRAIPLLAVGPAPKPPLLPAHHEQALLAAKPATLLLEEPTVSFSLGLPLGWHRKVMAFAVAGAMVLTPFFAKDGADALRGWSGQVATDALQGLALVRAAGAEAADNDFAHARLALDGAAVRFADAERSLGAVGALAGSVASVVAPSHPAASAQAALVAGRELAAAGSELAIAFANVTGGATPTAKLDEVEQHLDAALPHLTAGLAALAKVSADAVPEQHRAAFATAQAELPAITGAIGETKSLFGLLRHVLGAEHGRRYLVLFQNNAELRPTGGFIGSFALVDVDQGEIRQVEIPGGGSYDLQGSLRLNVAAPQPLRLINPKWEFQDANWSPDFPTTAATAREFYEKSGGPTTDGVIAITTTVLEKLLAVTGPIAMPEYGKTIDAGNFRLEAQKAVELEYDKAVNKPKQFIADLAPKVLEQLTTIDRSRLPEVAAIMSSALAERDVQVWLAEDAQQRQIASLGWDGALAPTTGDTLAIVHANVAGQKTDIVMKDDVRHEVRVLPDGSAIATVTLARTHTGTKGTTFTGVRNVDYVRVYVPKGSTLVEAKGFTPPPATMFAPAAPGAGTDQLLTATAATLRTDPDSGTESFEELGFTVFGNWLMTDPGATTTATLTYSLPPGTVRVRQSSPSIRERVSALIAGATAPAPMTVSYELTARRQAGLAGSFVSSLTLPRGARVAASNGYAADDEGLLTAAFDSLTKDARMGVVAEW